MDGKIRRNIALRNIKITNDLSDLLPSKFKLAKIYLTDSIATRENPWIFLGVPILSSPYINLLIDHSLTCAHTTKHDLLMVKS